MRLESNAAGGLTRLDMGVTIGDVAVVVVLLHVVVVVEVAVVVWFGVVAESGRSVCTATVWSC